MFSKDIGIDLGTANTLVFVKGKGIILREPSVVAVDVRTDTVRYVGKEAKEVIGRTPGSIVAVRPLKDGVIADFDITSSMLQIFIKKVVHSTFFSRPRIVICIPSGVTDVERRAVAGDSAGGTIAAALCVALRERGDVQPRAQALVYPVLSASSDFASMHEHAHAPMLTARGLAQSIELYLPDESDRRAACAMPLECRDFGDLAPALVVVAMQDL